MDVFDNFGKVTGLVTSEDFHYRYPLKMDLKPGSELHTRILSAVMDKVERSYAMIQPRFSTWNAIDETLTSYIPLSDIETKLKDDDSTKPVSVVIPVSLAVMETLLTYLVAAFFDSPIFRYTGVDADDLLGAQLLEKVIDVQVTKAKMGIQLHTMFRDSLAYGFGVVTPVWGEKWGYKRVRQPRGVFSAITGALNLTGYDQSREEALLFEGNELYNVDPYRYLPDPDVPIQDVQRGTSNGWIRTENRLDLLAREKRSIEKQSGENLFNVKYLGEIAGRSRYGYEQSHRDKRFRTTDNASTTEYRDNKDRVDVIYQYMDIVPSEWKVGKKDYPEKWLFGIAGDAVIISAGPSNLDHNMFPSVVCAPDYDGHSIFPVSKLESVYGLQQVTDFLYNSHIANVRKAIQDMFVADPQRINMNDLLNPTAGKIIRLRKKAWGSDVRTAISQLDVNDITRANIVDALAVETVMEKATGATSSLSGLIRPSSDRRSATEIRETKGSALSRLEKSARMASIMAMQDLAYILAKQTQQFMSQEQYVKIAGRSEQELRTLYGDAEGTMVGPLNILVEYDVEVLDGSIPGSGDPGVWAAIFQTISGNPYLIEQFDIVRIFQHWAKLSGAKNVSHFVNRGVNTNVVPDEEAAREAEKGNIVPMGETG